MPALKNKAAPGQGTQLSVKQALMLAGIAALYFIIMFALPTPAGLTWDGKKAIALMTCLILSLATQVVPMLISAVVFMFLAYVAGINTEVGIVKDFASPVLFFLMASILLAMAMESSGLSKRLALQMSVLSKGKPNALLFYIMLGTCIVGVFINNLSTCAAFLPIVLAICEKNKLPRGKSNFAKALMIGIIFGSMISGNATPAGSSMNVMGLNLLRNLTGMTLSFAKWSTLGFPIVILTLPVLWLIVVLVFPPEIKEIAGMEDMKKDLAALGRLNGQEIKFLVIVAAMVFAWFTQGILHDFSTSTISVFFATLFFFPGIGLLKIEHTNKINWSVIIITGVSFAFGSAMFNTGASGWLANVSLMPFANAHPLLLVFIIGTFTTLLQVLIPSCPACVSILVPTVAAFAAETGLSPMLLYLPVAFTVSACWLLPFDPLPLLCLPENYFSLKEYFKSGWIAHATLIVVTTIVVYFLGRPLGYF